MNQKTLHINGKDYAVKFGFAANRILANKWNLTSLGQVGKKLAKGLNIKGELTFDQYDIIGDLVIAGIQSLDKKANLSIDDVIDAILKDVDHFQEIIKLYTDSMPKAKTPEPSKNVIRGKKKK